MKSKEIRAILKSYFSFFDFTQVLSLYTTHYTVIMLSRMQRDIPPVTIVQNLFQSMIQYCRDAVTLVDGLADESRPLCADVYGNTA